ncbi:Complement C5, partial [Ophiophagus hannah]
MGNGRDGISPSKVSSSQALLQLEKSDLGCGAGGGENNVDVFRMAGLTFLTNANADDPREKGDEMSPFKHDTPVRICVADTLEVEVIKDVFVNVHIPYSVVRGEQIELKATIYNYRSSKSRFCLKISVQKGICLFGAAKTLKDGSQANTCSHLKDIQSSSIMVETFKVLPLELGLFSINLTLHSSLDKDILLKTLRVVKEFSYTVPRYIVPKTQLVKTLSIKGNLLGDVIQAAVKPEALKLLADLPQGSAERELMNIIPVFYVYDYLERTDSWDIFGSDRTSTEINLLRKMKRGIISVSSFQRQDFSYSMWKDGEASTWVTAFVLKVFGQVRRYMPDQFGTACTSLTWLIDICQMDDGSFREVSDYKPVALQGTLRDQERENRMYLTAFTLIAFSEYKKPCPFQKFADAENRAVGYLLENIAHSQNTFVLAIVTYALTQAKANHPDLHSAYLRLKSEAQVKGTPPAYRFWKETPIKFDASIPSEGNARMVETTAYTLLSVLLKGDHDYAKPVMRWLTEEQRFGGGFYSTQDTIIALECLTEYSILIKRLTLDMNVKASYKFQGDFHTYQLTSSNYIGRPVDASLKDDIEVCAGSNTGTAAVTLRSVYYVSSISEDTCDFQLKVDVTLDEKKYYMSFNEVRLLFACAKYKPRRRTGQFSSPHAVMDISLPNGLEANEEDLSLLSNSVDQMISSYEITPDGHVVMQVDSIPGNEFLCIGFRTTEIYRVGMSSPGTFSVYDYHDPDKKCTIFYNAYGEESLVKLCEGSECRCMEAECGHMQPQLDMSITLDTRKVAACQENIAYVYKVVIKSSKEEGSFVKYHAVLLEPYKLELLYQYPLDDLTWIEWWPSPNTACDSCQAFTESLDEFVDDLFLS